MSASKSGSISVNIGAGKSSPARRGCAHCHCAPCSCHGGLQFRNHNLGCETHDDYHGNVNNVHISQNNTTVVFGAVINDDCVSGTSVEVDEHLDHEHVCECQQTPCGCAGVNNSVNTTTRNTTINITAPVSAPIGLHGCAPKVTDCTGPKVPCGCEEKETEEVPEDTGTPETEDGTI